MAFSNEISVHTSQNKRPTQFYSLELLKIKYPIGRCFSFLFLPKRYSPLATPMYIAM